MIRAFKNLGEEQLSEIDISNKKIEFLKTLTIMPEQEFYLSKDNYITLNEIIFDFDLAKKEIEIKLGNELTGKRRDDYFGFEVPAPNNSKLFLTSNNWNYHLLTVPQSIEYLNKNKKLNFEGYKNYLEILKENFYDTLEVEEKKKKKTINFIKIEKLNQEQYKYISEYLVDEILKNFKKEKEFKQNLKKDIFNKINNQKFDYKELLNRIFEEIDKKIDTKAISEKILNDGKLPEKAFENLLKNKVLNGYKKASDVLKTINIHSIKFNGKTILETEYKNDYIEFMYFVLKDRFYEKKELVDSYCSCCNIKGDKKQVRVTKKVDIPTKFYNTNQKYFFENLDDNNAKYKAMCLCEDCFEKIMVGISKIDNEYSGKMFGINYYIIPSSIYKTGFDKKLKGIKKEFGNFNTIEKDKDIIKSIKRKEEKAEDLYFDILFWEKNQAEFYVLEDITDISYTRFKEIFGGLSNINEKIYSVDNKTDVNLTSLRYLLYPSRESHFNKIESKLFRKELLNLISSILKNREINYKYLIRNFTDIFKNKYFKKENKNKRYNFIDDTLKMNIVISWLNIVTKLKGGINKMEGNNYIPILNSDLEEFFKIHNDIYEKNYFKQGLVMLGMLINQVKKEQKEKSSTIIDRINFDGIPARRLNNLIKDVTEYLKIYKIFDVNGLLYSQAIDRLQGIEKSEMNKDEILFYILTGVGVSRYLSFKYSKDKKNNKVNETNIEEESNNE